MSDKWSLVLRNRKRLREVSNDDVGGITTLPSDVLALCLSYIEIKDIRNCWNTCKQFANVIKEKKHFWRAITRKQLRHIITKKEYLCFLSDFDPFSSLIEENLRDQFEWIFHDKRWISFGTYEDGVSYLRRRSKNGWVLCRVFGSFTSSYESPFGKSNVNYGIEHMKNDNGDSMSLYRGTVIKMNYRVEKYNAVWNGGGTEQNELFYPHGKGTWAFDDGTVVNGFADMGEFVYHANFEEWQKIRGVNSQNLLPP